MGLVFKIMKPSKAEIKNGLINETQKHQTEKNWELIKEAKKEQNIYDNTFTDNEIDGNAREANPKTIGKKSLWATFFTRQLTL